MPSRQRVCLSFQQGKDGFPGGWQRTPEKMEVRLCLLFPPRTPPGASLTWIVKGSSRVEALCSKNLNDAAALPPAPWRLLSKSGGPSGARSLSRQG
jgi:hypothetical protein